MKSYHRAPILSGRIIVGTLLRYLKLFVTLAVFFVFSICKAQKNNYHSIHPTKWDMVWNDEFTTDGGLDPSNWTFENGFVRNNELQWYQPQNAYCKDGHLVIEGRREQIKNPYYDDNSHRWKINREYASYTSASINTRGLHAWQYGRFEICARIDTSLGLWPAIWTLGEDGEWPFNGEIDVMEFYRINGVPHIMANVAWGTNHRWKAKWNTTKTPLVTIMKADNNWVHKFHVWRMDWDETSIHLYLDNVLLNTTLLSETLNPDGSNPFQQPHYLLLNLAIGENGGDPSLTKFPAKYEIDYVRVYQRK
jgi:beta-glucanase (GH16 family)